MKSKLYALVLINFFSLFGQAFTDRSLFINGPIYIVSNDNISNINYPDLKSVNGPVYFYSNKR